MQCCILLLHMKKFIDEDFNMKLFDITIISIFQRGLNFYLLF